MSLPTNLRMTLHLTAPDRELLEAIDARRQYAAATLAKAEWEFALAGTAMATSRGLRRVTPIEYTAAGLVVAVEVDATLPAAPTSTDPSSEVSS